MDDAEGPMDTSQGLSGGDKQSGAIAQSEENGKRDGSGKPYTVDLKTVMKDAQEVQGPNVVFYTPGEPR